jgi:hypothetical protein
LKFTLTLLDAVADWHVETPLDYGTNFTVRGPSQVLMSTA